MDKFIVSHKRPRELTEQPSLPSVAGSSSESSAGSAVNSSTGGSSSAAAYPSTVSTLSVIAASSKLPSSKVEPKKNAFSSLMSGAKKSKTTPLEVFHLHLTPQGCSWHWAEKSGSSSSGDNSPQIPSWIRTIPFIMSKNDVQQVIELRYSSTTVTALRPRTPGISLTAGAYKSLLQKAIRRRMKAETTRIAGEFFALDPVSAVRRGMVIVIEDTILHPAYPLLCWMLLAISSANGSNPVLNPSDELLSLFSYIMGEVAASSIKDSAWRTFAKLEKTEEKEEEKEEEATSAALSAETREALSPECISLVRSIRHRLRFGGQDKEMLSSAIVLWIQRFKSPSRKAWVDLIHSAYGNTCSVGSFDEGILTYAGKPLSKGYPGQLLLSDLPLDAIDNNVLPRIIDDLRRDLTQKEKENLDEWSLKYQQNIYDDKLISSTIWYVNGNLNFRTFQVVNDDNPVPSPVEDVKHKEKDVQLVNIFARAQKEYALTYLRQKVKIGHR
jgi:hypothetical protein